MTISFPRLMPENGLMQHNFDIGRVDYLSPESGGRIGAVTAGWPLWHLTASLNNMMPDDADIWAAWLDAQRGAQRLFYGFDSGRQIPRFHANGRPFDTSPSAWSQAIDGDGNCALTLNVEIPTVLSLRDYVGFEWGGTKRSLVRVVQGGASDGDGNLTVLVEPPIPSVTPDDATVNLNRATCLMRLVSSGTQMGAQMYGGQWTAAGTKVEAVQELLP